MSFSLHLGAVPSSPRAQLKGRSSGTAIGWSSEFAVTPSPPRPVSASGARAASSFLLFVHSLLYKVLEGRGSLGMLTPMELEEQGSMARGITQAPTELGSPRAHHQVKGLRTPRNYPQGPLPPGSAGGYSGITDDGRDSAKENSGGRRGQ